MSIDNDTAPGENLPKSLPTVLKFVLPDVYHRKDQDHYVVTTFPKTYQEAIAKAVSHLGKYMFDPTPENTILKCSTKNRKGEWVWADIPPENWTQIMRQFGSNEVGVFEEKLSRASAKAFVNGKVKLGAGKMSGRLMQWSDVSSHQSPMIIRPKNYKEAVEFVKEMIKTNYTIMSLSAPTRVHQHKSNRESFVNGLTTFRFFFFPDGPDTTSCIEFPHIAYADDDIWQSIVPLPGSILGVITTKNPEMDALARSDGRR